MTDRTPAPPTETVWSRLTECACPTCGAEEGESCKTKTGKAMPSENGHRARFYAVRAKLSRSAGSEEAEEKPGLVYLREHGAHRIYVQIDTGRFLAYPKDGEGEPRYSARLSDLLQTLSLDEETTPAIAFDRNDAPLKVHVTGYGSGVWRTKEGTSYRELFEFDEEAFLAIEAAYREIDRLWRKIQAAKQGLSHFSGRRRSTQEETP